MTFDEVMVIIRADMPRDQALILSPPISDEEKATITSFDAFVEWLRANPGRATLIKNIATAGEPNANGDVFTEKAIKSLASKDPR